MAQTKNKSQRIAENADLVRGEGFKIALPKEPTKNLPPIDKDMVDFQEGRRMFEPQEFKTEKELTSEDLQKSTEQLASEKLIVGVDLAAAREIVEKASEENRMLNDEEVKICETALKNEETKVEMLYTLELVALYNIKLKKYYKLTAYSQYPCSLKDATLLDDRLLAQQYLRVLSNPDIVVRNLKILEETINETEGTDK